MSYPNVPRGPRSRPSTAAGTPARPPNRSRASLVLAATHGLVAEAPLQDDAASLVVENHLGASLLLRWDTTTPTATEWHDRIRPYTFAVLPVPLNARAVKVLVSYATGAAVSGDARAVLYTHAVVLQPVMVPLQFQTVVTVGEVITASDTTRAGRNISVAQAGGVAGWAGTTGFLGSQTITQIVKGVALTAVAPGTPLTVWTPAAGRKARVGIFGFTTSVATQLILKSGGTEVWRGLTSTSHSVSPLGGWISAAANDVWAVDLVGAANVSGYIAGVEE